ncbi:hypothetical protein X801_00035 [Opisthorchis viverrini]|uniref:Uncharacterized protein n=1 Tax=Opisthorchis viverrini TaxID=6198 RepID=A0A1S8XCA3_OPIVI|nr:hypothetical protein X801_00035 [Opisthorchis viverrini]
MVEIYDTDYFITLKKSTHVPNTENERKIRLPNDQLRQLSQSLRNAKYYGNKYSCFLRLINTVKEQHVMGSNHTGDSRDPHNKNNDLGRPNHFPTPAYTKLLCLQCSICMHARWLHKKASPLKFIAILDG